MHIQWRSSLLSCFFDVKDLLFRCVASQEAKKSSIAPKEARKSSNVEKPSNAGELGSRKSPEARASSVLGVLPPEKKLSYGSGSFFGSTPVAIAVEKGESAVSISMRRNPVQRSGQQSSVPEREVLNEIMWSPIREPVRASQNYGPMWSPIREPLNVSQNYQLWSPTPGPIDVNAEEDWSPTPANPDEDDEQLWSPTPESERTSGSTVKDDPIVALGAPVRNLPREAESTIQSKASSGSSTSRGLGASSSGRHLSKLPSILNGSGFSTGGTESRSKTGLTIQPSQKPEVFVSSTGIQKDEAKFAGAQIGVEHFKIGKRKVLQEDE